MLGEHIKALLIHRLYKYYYLTVTEVISLLFYQKLFRKNYSVGTL